MVTTDKLDPVTQLLVERHVRTMVGSWLKWLGIGNLAVLLGLIGYVVFILPNKTVALVLTSLPERTAELTRQVEGALASGLLSAGKVQADISNFQHRAQLVNASLTQMEADLTGMRGSDLSEVTQLVRAIGDSRDASTLLTRVSDLETALSPLRRQTDPVLFTINNPYMRGPDQADCPLGSAVTSIVASRGVGGRYAVDGISELIVRCSPLLSK